jgi:mono/diheme cytochrome c family protein
MEEVKMLSAKVIAAGLAAIIGLAGGAELALAAETAKEPSQSTIDYGGRAFMRYCALCHGLDGRGGGPLAESLQKTPPDLTLLSERNGGYFPKERVMNTIEKGGDNTHGMMKMLSWGKVFNEEMGTERQAEMIQSLASYVEALQAKK